MKPRVWIGRRGIRTTIGAGGLTYVDTVPRGVGQIPGKRRTRIWVFLALAAAFLVLFWIR